MNYFIKLFAFVSLFSMHSVYASATAEEKEDITNTMISACMDHNEGDLCSFNNASGESVSGQCKADSTSVNAKLTCVPNG